LSHQGSPHGGCAGEATAREVTLFFLRRRRVPQNDDVVHPEMRGDVEYPSKNRLYGLIYSARNGSCRIFSGMAEVITLPESR
jgi:hypothetical protein